MKSIKVMLILLAMLAPVSWGSDFNELDFLIPGGEGGGWDTTARETGNALVETNLIKQASFKNFSGGGGARAMIDLIKHPETYNNTLMVQSTPLILRNITKVIPYSFRDIKPVALMIAEYQVMVVNADSPFTSLDQVVEAVRKDIAGNAIIGGSAKGSLDHITAALFFDSAGFEVRQLRYVAADGGGDALQRLRDHIGTVLVTGFGEVLEAVQQGDVRILAVSSANRVAGIDAPTFKEQGYNVVFANWRGFFAGPQTSDAKVQDYADLLLQLAGTDVWLAVREKYGWDDFVLTGDSLTDFLYDQERDISRIVDQIDFK